MIKIKKKSVRVQLILLLSFISVITLLFFSVVTFIYDFNETKKNTVNSLSLLTNIMSDNLIASIEFDDEMSAEAMLNTLRLNVEIDAALLYKGSGTLFSSYINPETDAKAVQALMQSNTLFTKEWSLKNFEYLDFNHIFINRSIVMDNEHLGSLLIIVNTKQLQKSFIERVWMQVLVSIVILGIIIFISNYLQRIFTRPIIKLKDVMAVVAKDQQYKLRIDRKQNDEFADLYNGFNDMLGIIEDQHEHLNLQQQQLASEMADKEQSEILAKLAKQQLENITNTIPSVVCQFTFSLGHLMVSFISNSIKKLHYIEPADVLQDFSCFIKSIHPDDQSFVKYTILDAVAKKSNFSCEYRVLLQHDEKISIQDSKIRWVSLQATVITDDEDEGGDSDDCNLFCETADIKDIKFNSNLIDITEAKIAHEKLLEKQKEIQEIHKHTRDSIKYASLIQSALIPENKIFREYFADFFVIWHPKDIVGGDIYLVEALNENELIIMVIDCTGHGVPGAFVTMLVKAIERQIMANIEEGEVISPAKILALFNVQIKKLLRQESIDSISNSGFDGAVLYFNKQKKIIRFAGAETPLFIVQNNSLSMIKGCRHSIGYRSSDINYEFKEHEIDVSDATQIYLTTDGYLDQNGGEKSFPFGKKRFKQIIEKYYTESFADQQEYLLYELGLYQQDEDRNDDITVIGLNI